MLLFFKNVLKRIVAFYFIRFGFIERAKKQIDEHNYILSIYFHNPTLQTFNDCIQWLVDNNFNFIDAKDILTLKEPFDQLIKRRVIITVDDGWRENLLNIVPIAHFNKIPITIFITTEPLKEGGGYWWSYIKAGIQNGITACTVPFLKTLPNINRLSIVNRVKSLINLDREAMTVEELKSIVTSPYINIGGHTLTHPILTNCSDDIADTEIGQSKSVLESLIPTPIHSFSYPNGNFSEREIKLVKKHGYQFAFTTKPEMIKLSKNLDLFKLPRFEVLDNVSMNENICRMTGVWF